MKKRKNIFSTPPYVLFRETEVCVCVYERARDEFFFWWGHGRIPRRIMSEKNSSISISNKHWMFPSSSPEIQKIYRSDLENIFYCNRQPVSLKKQKQRTWERKKLWIFLLKKSEEEEDVSPLLEFLLPLPLPGNFLFFLRKLRLGDQVQMSRRVGWARETKGRKIWENRILKPSRFEAWERGRDGGRKYAQYEQQKSIWAFLICQVMEKEKNKRF